MALVVVRCCLLLLVGLQGGLCGSLQVTPTYSIVKVGDPIVMRCEATGRSLEYCRVEPPGNQQAIIVRPNSTAQQYQYVGDGFDKGHCGFRIEHATEAHNGVFHCITVINNEDFESKGKMVVVIARTPTPPEMTVSASTEGDDTYVEGKVLHATCSVNNSRPATNFTWFLGDDVLKSGLSKPSITTNENKLQSTVQNVTRTIQSTDNGKQLRCVADHIGLTEQNKEVGKLMKVNFAPKSSEKPFEQFNMVEGAEGQVKIAIEANPRPSFVWNVDGETIVEGHKFGRYEVLSTKKKEVGDFWETVLIISSLTKEDVSKEYNVKASNKYGGRNYDVTISTSSEPKLLPIGAGTVVIILVIISLVLIVICAMVFARAKGRWCFSDPPVPRLAGESSDTESVDHTSSTNRKKASFICMFKKKPDKVPSDLGKETKEVAAAKDDDDEDDDDKIDTRLDRVEEDAPGNTTTTVLLSPPADDSVVYAELDLRSRCSGGAAGPSLVRGDDDDKTEYAEIIHSKPQPK